MGFIEASYPIWSLRLFRGYLCLPRFSVFLIGQIEGFPSLSRSNEIWLSARVRQQGYVAPSAISWMAPARLRDFALCWMFLSLASIGFLEQLKMPTDGALSTKCLPSPCH